MNDSYTKQKENSHLSEVSKSRMRKTFFIFAIQIVVLLLIHLVIVVEFSREGISSDFDFASISSFKDSINILLILMNIQQAFVTIFLLCTIDDSVEHLKGPFLPERKSKPSNTLQWYYGISNVVIMILMVARESTQNIKDSMVIIVLTFMFLGGAPFVVNWATARYEESVLQIELDQINTELRGQLSQM